MNPAIKEAFIRQSLRREIRKKVFLKRKSTQVISEETSLYSTFVEPFTDVLQAVNLASQDFLNSYITYLRMYITFSPKKGKELLKKHDERKAKIAEKWKPLMERTDKALSTGDADIVALVLAPQVFALSAVGEKAAEYSGDVKDFLNNTGLTGMFSAIPGLGALVNLDSDVKSEKDDDKTSLIDKLSILFFGAYAGQTLYQSFKKATLDATAAKMKSQQNENIVVEQSKKPNFEKDFAKFLDESGLKDIFEKDATELFGSFQETIQQFDDDYSSKEALITRLQQSQNLQDFVRSFEEAESVKGDLNEQEESQESQLPDPGKVRQDVEGAVKDLAGSEEFLTQVKEETGKEEVTEEELKQAAEKVIFLDSMKSFDEEVGGLDKALVDLKAEVGKNIQEMLPTDVGLEIMKKSKSPEAKKAVDLIEKTKQKYSIK